MPRNSRIVPAKKPSAVCGMPPSPRAASERRKVWPYMPMSPATRTLSPKDGMNRNAAWGALKKE